MPLQCVFEETQGSLLVPFLRYIVLEYLTLVIDCTLQIVGLSVDLYEHLIDVPAPVAKPTHSADALALDVSREYWAKPVPP